MFIPFGTLTSGQVDVVDKSFSVATEFFHIMWFPIFPTRSCVIVDKHLAKRFGLQPPEKITPYWQDDGGDADEADENDAAATTKAADQSAETTGEPETDEQQSAEEYRYQIPMRGRSVLVGYLRGWGFWLGIFLGFLGGMLALMSGDDPEAAQMYPGFLIAAGCSLAVAFASYYGPWNRAAPQRAVELCKTIGMDPQRLPNELRQHIDVSVRDEGKV
jgi:hypothetical protein